MGLYNGGWGTLLEFFRTNTPDVAGQFCPNSAFCLAGQQRTFRPRVSVQGSRCSSSTRAGSPRGAPTLTRSPGSSGSPSSSWSSSWFWRSRWPAAPTRWRRRRAKRGRGQSTTLQSSSGPRWLYKVASLAGFSETSQPISAQGEKYKNPQFNFKSTSKRGICKENGLSWRSL